MTALFRKLAKFFIARLAGLAGRQVFVVETKQRNYQLVDLNTLTAYWQREEAVDDYEASMAATGMSWSDNVQKRFRYQSVHQLANQAISRSPNGGDVAECGCWRGHSAHLIATILKRRQFKGKFHVFDSFQGLSEFSSRDADERFVRNPKMLSELRNTFSASESEVRANLAEFDFMEFYPGWIPGRFQELDERRFILVNIDLDLYEPTRDSVEFFLPRLIDGGVMIFNDYGYTLIPGAKKAVDEVVAKNDHNMFYQVPGGGAFLIK